MTRAWLVGIAAAVPMIAAACGGNGKSDDAFPTSAGPSDSLPTAQVSAVNAIVAGSEWIVGHNNFVVGITDKNDQPQGGAQVQGTFFDLRNPANPVALFTVPGVPSAPGAGPKTTHVHSDGDNHVHGGEDEDRAGYYFSLDFSYAGQWGVAVEATLKDGTSGVSRVQFTVADRPSIATPGQKAPQSNNLTAAEVDDLKKIDSGDPPNDMHDVKIKDSIAAGRPLVVLFATPAYCVSRFCGPVVQEIESLHDEFKDSVDFVHIEIWQDFRAQKVQETVKEWIVRSDGSLSEPFVYVVDRTGVIYDRWEGPIAANIVRPAVEEVAAGKTRLGN